MINEPGSRPSRNVWQGREPRKGRVRNVQSPNQSQAAVGGRMAHDLRIGARRQKEDLEKVDTEKQS